MFSIKNKLFRSVFLVLVLTGVLDAIGVWLHLYWSLRYFDVPMHFLGGFLASLVVLWIWSSKKDVLTINKNTVIIVSILLAMVVGILWELYELIIGMNTLADGYEYWLDTLGDMVMDFTGSVGGLIYTYWLLKKENVSIRVEK